MSDDARNNDDSVTQWIVDVSNNKTNDGTAAERLFDRYFNQITAIARRRMTGGRLAVSDEEDVALSVFQSVFSGIADGRLQPASRDELWALLLTMVRQKAIDHIRREMAAKRGGGRVAGSSQFNLLDDEGRGLSDLPGNTLPPSFLAMFKEEEARLLALLPNDQMREIARLRIEGYRNHEIAEQVGLAIRSVERKVAIIRQQWQAEIERQNDD